MNDERLRRCWPTVGETRLRCGVGWNESATPMQTQRRWPSWPMAGPANCADWTRPAKMDSSQDSV